MPIRKQSLSHNQIKPLCFMLIFQVMTGRRFGTTD